MRLVTLVDLNAGPLPAVTPPAARNAAWFPIVYQPTPVPPLTGGGSTPVADGVLLEWDAVDSGGAEVIYIIERSPNPAGPWEEVTRTTATRYLYSDGSGQTWYFRIIPTVRGQSGPSEVIEGVPNPVTARLVEIQMAADQATHDATEAQLKAAKALALMGEEYDPARGYVADDVVYLSGKMYRAKQAVPIDQPPPNATYWLDVGTVTQAQSNTSSAISQLRVDVDEQGVEFAAAIDQVESGLSTVTTTLQAIGGGGNLLTTSMFGAGVEPWTTAATVGAWQCSDTILQDGRVPAGLHAMVMYTASGAAGNFIQVYQDIPVEPGQPYIASAYLLPYQLRSNLSLVFINKSGAATGPAYDSESATTYDPSGLLSGYTRAQVKGSAPLDADRVRVSVWAVKQSATGADSALWVIRPMLEEARGDQEFPSPWSAGGAEQSARETVTLDVNGYVSGTQSVNDGKRSSFSILATVFRVISTRTGMGMEWQDGYLRIWKNAAQLILGHTFGSGDLVFWYGQNIGAGNCTKGNAIIWFDTAGSAYFGGTLSAGVRKNAAQSTQVSGTATVETGQFGTAGGPKVVTASFGYLNNFTTASNLGTSDTPLSATLYLERSIAGGAWSIVSSQSVSGTRAYLGFEPGVGYSYGLNIGGSVNSTDNTAGTSNFNYRTRLADAAGWPLSRPEGGAGALGTQSTSVLSVEQ